MLDIDKNLFLDNFAPSKVGMKRKTAFDNGNSISVEKISDFKYLVKYFSNTNADYYAPGFIFKTEGKLKFVPIPNLYTFLFIPLSLAILTFCGRLEKGNIWKISVYLMAFVILVQLILIIPSLYNIRNRINKNKS